MPNIGTAVSPAHESAFEVDAFAFADLGGMDVLIKARNANDEWETICGLYNPDVRIVGSEIILTELDSFFF
jgi:hypothetical protein